MHFSFHMMRPILTLAIAVACSVSNVAASHVQRLAITWDAGTAFAGNFSVSFEKMHDKRFSVGTMAHYYDARLALQQIFSYGYSLGLGVTPKLHVWGKAHEQSFYLAPTLKVGYLVHPELGKAPADHNILFRTGAAFGLQHVFNSGLIIDCSWGLEHYFAISLDKQPDRLALQALIIRPIYAISLGYSW